MDAFNDYQDSNVDLKSKPDKLGRYSARGGRKSSVARVWIKPGTGKFTVNKSSLEDYFRYETSRESVLLPFRLTSNIGKFDVLSVVKGGGTTGQVGAISLGISRALQYFDPGLRTKLKSSGLLTRDSRCVERKKYGRKKARKSFQFSKR